MTSDPKGVSAGGPGQARNWTALPGWAIDLISDGVDLTGGRSQVVKAVRQVMLSAHRAEVPYSDMHALLAGELRLAVQIRTGKGGRRISRSQRDGFLRQQWEDTEKLADSRPAWDRNTAMAAIEHVRAEFEKDNDLEPQDHAVVDAVLTLAEQHGTTRVAAPTRQIGKMVGVSKATALRALQRLTSEGKWLSLAKTGNYRTGRSNLYNLAPALLHLWGASPPKSQGVPTSHPPKSQSEGATAMSVALTASSPEALAEAIRLLARSNPDQVRKMIEDVQAEVPTLRVVDGGSQPHPFRDLLG